MLIPTDGGRYDVDLYHRQRRAIYWEEPVSEVRRCSWFYKGEGERWYLPYDEMQANKLEVCHSQVYVNLVCILVRSCTVVSWMPLKFCAVLMITMATFTAKIHSAKYFLFIFSL